MKTAEFLKYEINARQAESLPLEWESVFGRMAPLALEIGCGNGEFLVDWAQSRPEWNFVGIEISMESVWRIQHRIFRNDLRNVRVLREDARFALRELFPDASLRHVMMNFPDPWPKEKHRRRRTIKPEFVGTLAALLEIGGYFELVTDQDWYAGDAGALFKESECFDLQPVEVDPIRPVTTKYERKWRKEGRHTFRMKATQKKKLAIHRIVEGGEMPHVILHRRMDSGKILALNGLVVKHSDSVFAVKEIFMKPDDRACMLRMVASDKDYTQNFFILIAEHRDGFIVKIDAGIQPYRTPAVKFAVFEIGRLLDKD